MDRSLEYKIAVMTAFKDGAAIEFSYDGLNYSKITTPAFNWEEFDYRLKQPSHEGYIMSHWQPLPDAPK